MTSNAKRGRIANQLLIAALFLKIIQSPAQIGAAEAYTPPSSEWKPLFNGEDFSNWDKYLSLPTGDDPLVANQDPKDVFSVREEDGENVIHVTGEVFGAITTREEFENMHFRIDFKWGPKRWPPRAHVGRDTGILYCCIGAPNPRTGWMTSIENNIMEKGVGQWWSVNGAIIDVEGEYITPETELYVPYKKEGDGEQNIVWKKGSSRITAAPANGITPPFDMEQVFGNWNTVEVVFWAGNCIHILNGHVNLVAFNPRYKEGERWRPLTRGKIQLQSEAAEVFYRKPEVRPIYGLPPELMEHVVSPVEGEEGFISLFSEKALTSWKQCGAGKFTIENGIATGEGGMGLWWYSATSFTNFVLRGEFLQSDTIADSGVFLRFPDPGDDPWVAVRRGHEIEIGDPDPANPTWRTGAIYPFQASVAANTKPPGEWNTYEIVCKGQDYTVRINGKVVNTWTDTTARTLGGFIGLQNYNDGKSVRHRNLRIREL